MEHCDIAIIGAGLVGLASALALRKAHPQARIAVIEKEDRVAAHQSGRNSGVIHSGVYYQPGSEKAKNCIRGYQLLLDFCDSYGVDYLLCGKLIVAKDTSEEKTLLEIFERGRKNGLTELRLLNQEQAREIEPNVLCHKAIHVPQAGIISFGALAVKIAEVLREEGVEFLFGHRIKKIREEGEKVIVCSDKQEFSAGYLVNCGGLYADTLCRMSGLDPGFRIVPFRGEFYRILPPADKQVNGLIYPVPDLRYPFLGIHLTSVIDGGLEAGPNAVLAWRREGYTFTDFHGREFLQALGYRGFWRLATAHWKKGIEEIGRSLNSKAFHREVARIVPSIQHSDLKFARTGVRAQAVDPKGQMIYDYLLRHSRRITHVCNAPSPAATSCLAIGEFIREIVSDRLSYS